MRAAHQVVVAASACLSIACAGSHQLEAPLESALALLADTIVTGYTAQQRAAITGAVATVDVTDLSRQTSNSVLQRLDGRVPGVTVENGGSPGSRTTVRIRGVTSFHDNDPLYVIDGTPVQESYLNWLNPDDIEAVQVLKDGSPASIYGSRGGNGVVPGVSTFGIRPAEWTAAHIPRAA